MNLGSLSMGFTVAEVAKHLRVGADKVRSWIKSGQLVAINTSGRRLARPRYIVTPEALAAFERGRVTAATPREGKRTKKSYVVDFYPD
jgi:excisionase family DNA binding protein